MIGKMKYRMNTEKKGSRGPFSQSKQREENRHARAAAESERPKAAERADVKESRYSKTETQWPGAKASRGLKTGAERPGAKASRGSKTGAEWPGAKASRSLKAGAEWFGTKASRGPKTGEWSEAKASKGPKAGAKWSEGKSGKGSKAGMEWPGAKEEKGASWFQSGNGKKPSVWPGKKAEAPLAKTGRGTDWAKDRYDADRYQEKQSGNDADRYEEKHSGRYAAQTENQAESAQYDAEHSAEPKMEEDAALPKIEGRNAVLEAFRSGKTVDKLFVLDGCKDGPVQTIVREAKKQDTVIHFVDKDRLNKMSETRKHQGVIAVTAAYEYASVEDILARAEEKGEEPFIILLDNIEDPHNLGAIIRTANLAGAHGVIIPKRRAAGLTGTVAKASAGAVSYTPVAKVTNLSQTIRELKEQGIWFVCADMDGEVMYRQNLTGPLGLVIGGEGEGVSRLVKENCDFTASIPMKGELDSLNASAAAAVLSYEIVRQRTLKA